MNYILLQGGREFYGQMASADRQAIVLSGGYDAHISIIPTAAVPDNNHKRAGDNGVSWFNGLGAIHTRVLPLIDPESADDPGLADELLASDLIFLLGGFPTYLADTLSGSLCWAAIMEAGQKGAIIAGSSAGAMVLCEHYYDPASKRLKTGLNLIPNACILPHHNTYGNRWYPQIRKLLPGRVLIGIDEQTAILNDGSKGAWQVYGDGAVTLYRKGRAERFAIDQQFSI